MNIRGEFRYYGLMVRKKTNGIGGVIIQANARQLVEEQAIFH